MIFVDTSVWIDFLRARQTRETTILDRALGIDEIVLGDLVLYEVLAGARDEQQAASLARAFAPYAIVELGGAAAAQRAAQNYRRLRALGVTVRKSIDVFIGSYCIAHALPLLHADRDFEPMAQHLRLNVL